MSCRHHERGWRAEQPAPRGPHGAPGRPGALNVPGPSWAKSRHHIWAMGSPCHHPVITSPSLHSIRRPRPAGRAGQARLTHTDPQTAMVCHARLMRLSSSYHQPPHLQQHDKPCPDSTRCSIETRVGGSLFCMSVLIASPGTRCVGPASGLIVSEVGPSHTLKQDCCEWAALV